jgi:hypothetical protein
MIISVTHAVICGESNPSEFERQIKYPGIAAGFESIKVPKWETFY